MLALLLAALLPAANPARMSDAFARSEGNDPRLAHAIGDRIFARIEPVQVVKVRVDAVNDHRVASLLLSGVKFHGRVTYASFLAEVERLALDALAAAPVEEVDVEVVVPPGYAQGVLVGGDGNIPQYRTVFTMTVKRNETAPELAARAASGNGIFWDAAFFRALRFPA